MAYRDPCMASFTVGLLIGVCMLVLILLASGYLLMLKRARRGQNSQSEFAST